MLVGRRSPFLLGFGNFSGAMLNFMGVVHNVIFTSRLIWQDQTRQTSQVLGRLLPWKEEVRLGHLSHDPNGLGPASPKFPVKVCHYELGFSRKAARIEVMMIELKLRLHNVMPSQSLFPLDIVCIRTQPSSLMDFQKMMFESCHFFNPMLPMCFPTHFPFGISTS